MRKLDIEIMVGLFIVAGVVCLAYLSISFAKMEVFGGKDYELKAIFTNTGGLKVGSGILIAGVEIGRVRSVSLDNYQAHIVMALPMDVKIQDDAIASIKTKGLIGEKFIDITPGGSDKILPPGARIRETQPAVDMEELISRYVFGKI